MPQVNGILETSLYVEDVRRTVAFYREVLDATPLVSEERFAALEVAGRNVLLVFKHAAAAAPTVTAGGVIPPHDAQGRVHLAFAIDADQFEAWKARLEGAGVAVESTVAWPRGGRSMYFRDPDGHSVELVTPGTWAIY